MRGRLVNMTSISEGLDYLLIEDLDTRELNTITVDKGVCNPEYIGNKISINTTIVPIVNSDQKSNYQEELSKFR